MSDEYSSNELIQNTDKLGTVGTMLEIGAEDEGQHDKKIGTKDILLVKDQAIQKKCDNHVVLGKEKADQLFRKETQEIKLKIAEYLSHRELTDLATVLVSSTANPRLFKNYLGPEVKSKNPKKDFLNSPHLRDYKSLRALFSKTKSIADISELDELAELEKTIGKPALVDQAELVLCSYDAQKNSQNYDEMLFLAANLIALPSIFNSIKNYFDNPDDVNKDKFIATLIAKLINTPSSDQVCADNFFKLGVVIFSLISQELPCFNEAHFSGVSHELFKVDKVRNSPGAIAHDLIKEASRLGHIRAKVVLAFGLDSRVFSTNDSMIKLWTLVDEAKRIWYSTAEAQHLKHVSENEKQLAFYESMRSWSIYGISLSVLFVNFKRFIMSAEKNVLKDAIKTLARGPLPHWLIITLREEAKYASQTVADKLFIANKDSDTFFQLAQVLRTSRAQATLGQFYCTEKECQLLINSEMHIIQLFEKAKSLGHPEAESALKDFKSSCALNSSSSYFGSSSSSVPASVATTNDTSSNVFNPFL